LRGDSASGRGVPRNLYAPQRGYRVGAGLAYNPRLSVTALREKDFRMSPVAKTVLLLTLSNVFMTFAWYAHLRNLAQKPWIVAAMVSWGIALFEYLLQVPANRIGHKQLELGQLKILQEAITLTVFVPFALLYMKEPVRLNFLWAGLCICGAVFFIFRK
jgi:uncharacterized protein (DUF486 family)